jgi:type VI secretion system protein ImpF
MADTTSRELLQPALLDRLTDDEPQKQVESRDQRILSMRAFKDGVMRDLGWLLNTGNFDGEEKFQEWPNVADSVLNYGIRDLCGLSTSGISEGDVERYVREAIRRFEPRILPKSLAVRVKVSKDAHSHNAVAFEISGDLWATPMPERMYLQTKVDLERGDFEFESSLTGGSR